MSKLTNMYANRYRALVRDAQAQPLLFRATAQQVFQAFSRKERTENSLLTTESTSAIEFYSQWNAQLVPEITAIEQATTAKSLQKDVVRYLLLNTDQATELISSLVLQRSVQIINQFIEQFYKNSERKARKAAKRFILRSMDENSEYIERYITYSLYRQVALEERMTIYDAHASLITRLAQSIRQSQEISSLRRRTHRQMRVNSRLMSTIEQQNEGLVASLFALNIDLVAIRSAYQSYEKALDKLSDTQKKSPSKQLALYEKETASLRAAHLESISGIHGLQDTKRAAAEIDAVLLRIFDLTNRQYNELMTQLKRYRDLEREQKRLTTRLKR